MSYVMPPFQTINAYPTADGPGRLTNIKQNIVRVMLTVHNASIYVQFQNKRSEPSTMHFPGNETFLAPGFYIFRRRIGGIQIRSAITGQPALVTAELLEHDE